MSELQFEELKLWLFLVGVACASDNVFRLTMLLLVAVTGLSTVTMRVGNHYKTRIEELEKLEKQKEPHENSKTQQKDKKDKVQND